MRAAFPEVGQSANFCDFLLDISGDRCYNTIRSPRTAVIGSMRECWNWQTGTFEVRVSKTYGFKSRFSHHQEAIKKI